MRNGINEHKCEVCDTSLKPEMILSQILDRNVLSHYVFKVLYAIVIIFQILYHHLTTVF